MTDTNNISYTPEPLGGADRTRPYFYLAGPMTGIPQFNFPMFDRIAGKLRAQGYNIVSPAELDDPDARAEALASPDGAGQKEQDADWRDYLRRDVNIVMDENCVGVICMAGWEGSKGALLETYVAQAFGKEISLYVEFPGDRECLVVIDREASLRGYAQMMRPVDHHPV